MTQSLQKRTLYTLIILIIIAMISTSVISIFTKNKQNKIIYSIEDIKTKQIESKQSREQVENSIFETKVFSLVSDNNDIKFDYKYLEPLTKIKHKFLIKKNLYKYIEDQEKSKVIQDIIKKIKIPKLNSIIHKKIDSINHIIEFKIKTKSGDDNIKKLEDFITHIKKNNNENLQIQNIIESFKEIFKDGSINEKSISFVDTKEVVYSELLTGENKKISKIHQNTEGEVSFAIITHTEPGFFQLHNITSDVLQNIIKHDIINQQLK